MHLDNDTVCNDLGDSSPVSVGQPCCSWALSRFRQGRRLAMIKEVGRHASPNMFTGKGQLEGDGGSTVALVVAGAYGLGLVGVGVLTFAVEAGHERDAAMLHGCRGRFAPTFNSAIRVTAQLADPVP